MKFIFKDTQEMKELTLPVTPPSFEVSNGIRIETVNIHTVGDVHLSGLKSLGVIKISCLFPARRYPFVGTEDVEPYALVEKFKQWSEKGTVLRLIISETPVNVPVLAESISYGEKDGTGDVYADLVLQEYRYLRLPTYYSHTQENSRTVETEPKMQESYTVVSGDTLSGICKKFYGDASLYPKVAAVNGIKNPHLIYPGNVIVLPDKAAL